MSRAEESEREVCTNKEGNRECSAIHPGAPHFWCPHCLASAAPTVEPESERVQQTREKLVDEYRADGAFTDNFNEFMLRRITSLEGQVEKRPEFQEVRNLSGQRVAICVEDEWYQKAGTGGVPSSFAEISAKCTSMEKELKILIDASLPIADTIQEAEWLDEMGIEYMVLTAEFEPQIAAEFVATFLTRDSALAGTEGE